MASSPGQRNCSELAATLSNIAFNIGSRDGVRNIDDIVERMRSYPDLADIRREDIVGAIVEATQVNARARSNSQKVLADIKREAKRDKKLRAAISEYEEHLQRGTFPADNPRRVNLKPDAIARLENTINNLKKRVGTEKQIQKLQEHLDNNTLPPPRRADTDEPDPYLVELQAKKKKVQEALRNSPPAVKQRLERQIEELTQQIADNNFAPPVKREKVPLTKELERLEFERDRLRQLIKSQRESLKPKGALARLAEPFNLSRAIITSLDFSAVLRQGGFIALGHPVRAAKSILPMFKAFGSEKQQLKIDNEIYARPNAPLYKRSKLYLAPLDNSTRLGLQEEAFLSGWLNKLHQSKAGRIAFQPVFASQRAYITFLNKLRADSFDTMVATLSRNGEPTEADIEAIANYINVATGRGWLGSDKDASAALLNATFFAPRLVTSRFQLLTGQPIAHGAVTRGPKASLQTRALIAKEYGRFLIGIGLVYALGQAAGAAIENDPRSSDFGKLRFGNTRLDPLGGLSQMATLMARVGFGESKNAKGEIVPLRGDDVQFGGRTVPSTIGNFLWSKSSPLLNMGISSLAGKNVVGENRDVTTKEGALALAADATIPLYIRDVADSMAEDGIPRGTAYALLSMFGMGLQNYKPRETKDDSGGRPKRPSRPKRPERPTR